MLNVCTMKEFFGRGLLNFAGPLKITHSILNNFLETLIVVSLRPLLYFNKSIKIQKKMPFVFEIWLSAHSHVFLSFYPSHFRSNGKLPSFRGWGQPLTSGRISVWWIGLCPPMIWRTFLDSIRTIGCIYHLSKADLGVVITRITHLRLRQFNISLFSLL